MYRVLNISGGQLVCTLASGNTMRLDDRKYQEIKDTDMTDYLKHIESLGLVKCTKIVEEETPVDVPAPTANKKGLKKTMNDEKED